MDPFSNPESTPAIEPQPDFPLHVLPTPFRDYIETSSLLTRVPPEMIAFPLLAFTGGLIGTRLRIQVSPTWFERPALWVALIAPTGNGKSPAIRAARLPFDILQQESRETSRDHVTLNPGDGTPRNPPRPKRNIPSDRVFTSSIATNDLALLLANTHGITILRDELIGLVRMFNRHGGDDRQRYLSLWSSEPISAIRRDQPDLWIPAPVVSIVGGLQPSLLPRLRSRDEDGLLERFLPIYSLNQQPYWNETATTAPDTETISRCFRTLTHIPNDSIVQRSPEATSIWTTWFNHNVDRTAKTPETGRGFYNKLPAHINRLALILHSLAYPDNPTTPIAGETMTSAIELGEFVRSHIHRTLHRLSQEKPAPVVKLPLDQAILRALDENMYDDGWLSRNQLRIAVGRPTAENFSPALESLLSRRRIEFRIGETNSPGRPTILYRLFEL